MLPNALRPSATDHSGARRRGAAPARRPARRARRRRDVRRRRPRRAARARHGRQGSLHRHRPRSVGTPATSSASVSAPVSRRGSCAASSRPCSTSWRRTMSVSTPSCSISASPACRSTAPSADSRTRSTRRSTCAWILRRRDRGRHRQRRTRARAAGDLPPLWRGAVRASDRPCHHSPPSPRAVRSLGRARRRDQDRHPDAGSLRRGPSGQARLSGTADRGQRRARPARRGTTGGDSSCRARTAGSPSSASTRSGPDREAYFRAEAGAVSVRRTFRSVRAARILRCAC